LAGIREQTVKQKVRTLNTTIEDTSEPELCTSAESKSFFSGTSYLDYFVPVEWFDVEAEIHNAECAPESIEFTDFYLPGDDPPSSQQSIAAPASIFSFTRLRIKAE
jgi:hypothetical protein